MKSRHSSLRRVSVRLLLRAAAVVATLTVCAPRRSIAENIVIRKPPDIGFVYLRSLSFEEAREIAEPFLSEKGRLGFLASRNLLIIHDYDENIEAVRKAIARIDTDPVNIRITVTFDEARGQSGAAAGVRDAHVTVTHRDGDIRVTGSGVVVLGARDRRIRDVTTQSILTANGRAASIWVGETVADPVWVRKYGLLHGWWEQEIVTRHLGASLWARPRLLPDGTIEIEVWPRITARGRRRLSVDVKEVATRVVTRDGQPVRIGGVDRSRRETYRRLFGIGRVFNGRDLSITLTPQVVRLRTPHHRPEKRKE